MRQTLEERIEEFKQIYADLPKAKDALEIITELQKEKEKFRQIGLDWMATAKDREKKLDEALAKVEIAKKGLEALNKHCEGNSEALSILNQCYDQLIYNKQGEKHDK